jgi:hypothetical protein
MQAGPHCSATREDTARYDDSVLMEDHALDYRHLSGPMCLGLDYPTPRLLVTCPSVGLNASV